MPEVAAVLEVGLATQGEREQFIADLTENLKALKSCRCALHGLLPEGASEGEDAPGKTAQGYLDLAIEEHGREIARLSGQSYVAWLVEQMKADLAPIVEARLRRNEDAEIVSMSLSMFAEHCEQRSRQNLFNAKAAQSDNLENVSQWRELAARADAEMERRKTVAA